MSEIERVPNPRVVTRENLVTALVNLVELGFEPAADLKYFVESELLPALEVYLHERFEGAVRKARNTMSETERPDTANKRIYPCADCGKMLSKAEGGTVFTVCEACWDRHYKRPDTAESFTDAVRRIFREMLPFAVWNGANATCLMIAAAEHERRMAAAAVARFRAVDQLYTPVAERRMAADLARESALRASLERSEYDVRGLNRALTEIGIEHQEAERRLNTQATALYRALKAMRDALYSGLAVGRLRMDLITQADAALAARQPEDAKP